MKRRKSSMKNSSTSSDEDDVDESINIQKIVAKARAIHEAKPANHLKHIEAAIKKNYRRSVVHRAVNPYVIASTPCGPPAGMALSQNISSISTASNVIENQSIHQSINKHPEINGDVDDFVENSFKNPSINHELSQKISRSRIYTDEYVPEKRENVQCSNIEQKNTSIKHNSHHSLGNITKNSGSKLKSIVQEEDSDSSVFIEDEPSRKNEKTKTIPEVKLNGNSLKLDEKKKENSHYALPTKNGTIRHPPSTKHEDTISSSSSYNFRVRTANSRIIRNGELKQNHRKNRIRNNYNSESFDEQNTVKPYLKPHKNGVFKGKRPSKYSHKRNESYSSVEEGTTRRRTSRHYSRTGHNRESKKKTIRPSVSRKTYHHKHNRHPSRERYYSKSGRRKHYSSSSHSTSTYTESDDDEKTITKTRRMSRVEKYEQDLKYGRRRKSCNSRKSSQRNRDSSDDFTKRRRRPTPEKPEKSESKAPDSETLTKVVGMLAAQLIKIQKDDIPVCSNDQSTALLGRCPNTHSKIRSAHEKIRTAFDWNKFLGNDDTKKNWLHKYERLQGNSFNLAHSDEWSQEAGIASPTRVQIWRQLARKPFREVDARTRAKLQETKISECSVEDDGSVQVFQKSRNQSRKKVPKSKRNLNDIVNKLTTCTTKSRKKKNLNHLLKTDKSNKALLDEILGYVPQKIKTIPNKQIVKIKDQGTSPFILEPHIEFSPRRKVLQEIMPNESNRYKSSPLFGWGTTRDSLNDEELDISLNRSVNTPKTRAETSKRQHLEQKRTSKIDKPMLNRSIQTSRELIKDETLKPEPVNKSAAIIDCSIIEDNKEKSKHVKSSNKDQNRNSRSQKILQLSRRRLSFLSTSADTASTESDKIERKSTRSNGKILEDEDIRSDDNKAESQVGGMAHVVTSDTQNEDVDKRKKSSLVKDYGKKSTKISNNRTSNPVNVSLGSTVEFRSENVSRRTRSTSRKTANLNDGNQQTNENNNKILILQNVTVARKKRSNVDNNMNMNISYVAPDTEDINVTSTMGKKNLSGNFVGDLDVSKKKTPENSSVEIENLHEESCIVSTPKLKDKSRRKMQDDIFSSTEENEENMPLSSPSKRSRVRKNQDDKSVVDPEISNPQIVTRRSRVQDESGRKFQGIEEKDLVLSRRTRSRGRKTQDLEPETCPVSKSTLSNESSRKTQDYIEEIEENDLVLSPRNRSTGRKSQEGKYLIAGDLEPENCPAPRSTLSNENARKTQDYTEKIEEHDLASSPRKKRKTQDDKHLLVATIEAEILDLENCAVPSTKDEGEKKILDEKTDMEGCSSLSNSKLKNRKNGKIEDRKSSRDENPNQETCPEPSPELKKKTGRKAKCSADQNLEIEKSKTAKGKSKKTANISVAVRASTRERRPPRACWWKETLTKRDCEIYGNLFVPTVSTPTEENDIKSLKNNKTKKTKQEPKPKTKNITKKPTSSKVVPKENLEPSTSATRVSTNVNEFMDTEQIPAETVHDANTPDKQTWNSINEKVNSLCVGKSSSFSGNQIFNTNVEHGILRLAPQEKRRSINKHYTVIYYVLKGTFSLKIGHTYSETPPVLFIIPKGKHYVFHNKHKKPVLLAYVIDES